MVCLFYAYFPLIPAILCALNSSKNYGNIIANKGNSIGNLKIRYFRNFWCCLFIFYTYSVFLQKIRSSEDDEDLYDDESLENSNSDQESTSKIPLRSNSKSQESRKIKMIENTKPQPDSCRDDNDDVDDDDDSDDDDDCEENNEDEDFEDLGEQKKFTHRNITTKSRKLSKSSLSNQRLSKIKQIDIKQNNDGQRNAKDISTTKIANKDDDDTPLYDLPLKKSSINKRASVPNKKVT